MDLFNLSLKCKRGEIRDAMKLVMRSRPDSVGSEDVSASAVGVSSFPAAVIPSSSLGATSGGLCSASADATDGGGSDFSSARQRKG